MNKKEQALQKKKALKEKKAQTKHVNKHISPLSSGDTKNLFTSDGQEIGCL